MLPSTSASSAMPSTVVDIAGEASDPGAVLRQPDRLVLSEILGEDYEHRTADGLTLSEVERLLNARVDRPVLFLRDREPKRRPSGWASDHTPEVFFSACGNEELAAKTKFDCCRHCKKIFANNDDRKKWTRNTAIRQYFDYVGAVDSICRACARHYSRPDGTTHVMVKHLENKHKDLFEEYKSARGAPAASGINAAFQHIHANECPNQPAVRDSTVRATKRKRLAAEASTPAASDQRASENVEKENAAPAGALKDAVAKWMAAGPQHRMLAAEAKFKELVQTLVEIGGTVIDPVDVDAQIQQLLPPQAPSVEEDAAPALPPLGTKAGIDVPQLPIVDVTLDVGGEETVRTSSAYLAAFSPYFERLFGADFREKAEKRAKLDDVDPVDFAHFLGVIYPSGGAITAENVIGVLQLADRFNMPSLVRRCVEFLEANVDADNVFGIIDLADRFGQPSLLQRCVAFVERDTQLMPASKLLVFDRFPALHDLRDRFLPTLCKLKLIEVIRSAEFASMSQDCKDAVTYYLD